MRTFSGQSGPRSIIGTRVAALVILIAGAVMGFFLYASQFQGSGPLARFPFRLGLDLAGGTELVYRADTSGIAPGQVSEAMAALRDVIETRTNLFGVSEPLVQVEQGSALSGVSEERLLVQLPGVTDIREAVAMIGKTPLLEFKLLRSDITSEEQARALPSDQLFIPTGLTGRFLANAQLLFGAGTGAALANEPVVTLEFNSEGAELFAKITREHQGEILAIFLDGAVISSPMIQNEITGGKAQISGSFTPEEARELVRNLNFGALPLPIELIATQTVGATLGASAVAAGVYAGVVGFLSIALFLILWYRLPGVLAVLSLGIYVVAMLSLFKLIPVTLTAAGIAGFILSVGMAVDANVLIFERIKEELRQRADAHEAILQGFSRAWFSIRDANISSIISAVILFWLGTSLVRGFAVTFGLGVIISVITAVVISRTFLLAVSSRKNTKIMTFLLGNGIR